jgi:hypothetical protein
MEHNIHTEADQALLDASPNFLSIGEMFKATPATEGDQRFVYMEASNESRDLQDEVILQKALKESAEYFLKFGNIDLDHYTQIGRPNPAKGSPGIPGYEAFEIGRPVDVRVDGTRTFVKALINSGTGPAADKANYFWSSIDETNPPKRWYPSVGGAVLVKAISVDPSTGAKFPVITKVRWSNIGMSLTPVNADVPEVSCVPIGLLAKSWGAAGLDLRKSLEAGGGGTDVADFTGGAAIGKQSLDKGSQSGVLSYWDFRDQFAHAIHTGAIQTGDLPNMVKEAGSRFGLSQTAAAEYVERFLDDLKRGLQEKS